HLLTKEEEFLYAIPKRTIDKRSTWRKLARRKVGVGIKSAARRSEGRPVLYGTGLEGTKVKRRIVREAALRAERIYEAIVRQRRESETGIRSEDLIFDPTRPRHADWEQVLSSVAEQLIENPKVPKA
ncbi:MAG: hypothetical protein OEQ39_27005, partial [Gammaproteobacteria bacterium]|nr:hypothetical protein [Gammaproteobacteria bacterium]